MGVKVIHRRSRKGSSSVRTLSPRVQSPPPSFQRPVVVVVVERIPPSISVPSRQECLSLGLGGSSL